MTELGQCIFVKFWFWNWILHEYSVASCDYLCIFLYDIKRNLAKRLFPKSPKNFEEVEAGLVIYIEIQDLFENSDIFRFIFLIAWMTSDSNRQMALVTFHSHRCEEKNISYPSFFLCTHWVQWQMVTREEESEIVESSTHVTVIESSLFVLSPNVTCRRKIDRHGVLCASCKWWLMTRIQDYR